ncbi:MAG: M42 family metallopeptidase [Paracoccaceae bacterium]|nr:M42 family metallopeptidase [Paracoccaceae bacterium]MDE2914618.1 M42 family metallopeptidase [Paracoccaceae bacterium]
MKDRLRSQLVKLMMIPGLSGHEGRVRRQISGSLDRVGCHSRSDRFGNLIATLEGAPGLPSVMLFSHMDQVGFVVRKIRDDGLLRVERLGGVPERATASQAVTLSLADGTDVPGVIANKSHHATLPDEKYKVVQVSDALVDTGYGSREAVEAAGIRIGTPVVYTPRVLDLAGDRVAGTSIDDRAGCAVLLEVAEALAGRDGGPTVHVVFSVQEEFNLRGAVVAAQALRPDIAIQLDIMLATDTPGMEERGEMRLGSGPGLSLYSFHGRGTLNGVIPHPAMVKLITDTALSVGIPLQRSAQLGVLTDNSYVQFVGDGVAAVDVGFPVRYTHSSLEVCDLGDLEALARLLVASIDRIGPGFHLDREGAGL